jgi:hypothetical protein
MAKNPIVTLVVWIEIALFMGAAVFLLLGIVYYFVERVILPLF